MRLLSGLVNAQETPQDTLDAYESCIKKERGNTTSHEAIKAACDSKLEKVFSLLPAKDRAQVEAKIIQFTNEYLVESGSS